MTPNAIRMLVLAAYEEGFRDGVDHEASNWKYPPINLAWLNSTARIDAGYPALNRAQVASWEAWDRAKIDDQRDCERETQP